MKLFIVEDDKDLNETLKDFLSDNFEVVSIFDGDKVAQLVYEENPHLILLDVKLPNQNGFEIAKEIRRFSNAPIIFLTSLNSEKDIEKGFLQGADDYITKPFSLKELKFRIDAIIRRVYGDILFEDSFEFDKKNLILIKDNQEIKLKLKEGKLLELFLLNKNRILSKDEIAEYLYEMEEPNFHSIKTFLNSLRKYIGKERIKTIKNVGYKFVG